MIQLDFYTIASLFLAITLAVIGLQLLFKHIPQEEEFTRIRIVRKLLVAVYLLTSVITTIEFLFWKKYNFSDAAFIDLSLVAYQFVLMAPTILACLNPEFLSRHKLSRWLGITSAWVLPLGVLNYIDVSWAVYATYAAYIVQMAVGLTFFYRDYKERLLFLKSCDVQQKFNLRWLKFGCKVLIGYCVLIVAVTLLPPFVHNIYTMLLMLSIITFSTRFTSFADHVYHDYHLPTLVVTEQETPPSVEIPEEILRREEHCRQVVDAWIARKGFCDPDPDRDSAADHMGLDRMDLLWYLSACLKTEFRSWRVKLRIEEAKNVLSANPDVPINELARALGFNSRGNFFTYFKKYTGEQTTEFIARVHKK